MSRTNTFRHLRRQKRWVTAVTFLAVAIVAIAAVVAACIFIFGNRSGSSTPSKNPEGELPATSTTDDVPALRDLTTDAKAQLDAALTADNVLLYDVTNERVVYEKNADKACYPASLTKIMTAAVAAKYATDEPFTVGKEVYLMDSQASSAYLKLGMTLTLPQMLQALLLPSGGDAAYCLAVHTATRLYPEEEMSYYEAAAKFCDLMNQELTAIGASNTTFINPDGIYHTYHQTTANDMQKVLQFAWQYDEVRNALCLPRTSFTTEDGSDLSYTNTNRLLNTNFPTCYYEYALGGKTGYVDEAGYCLGSVAQKNGTTLMALVFGCDKEDLRFTESIQLYNAGFSLYDAS